MVATKPPFNWRYLLNSVFALLIIGALFALAYTLASPAPLRATDASYTRHVYELDCAPGCAPFHPGDTITWHSETVTNRRTSIDTNISVWNDSCNRAAYAGDGATLRHMTYPRAGTWPNANRWTIPATFAPGAHTLTRSASERLADEIFYTVSFVVAGEVRC